MSNRLMRLARAAVILGMLADIAILVAQAYACGVTASGSELASRP